MPPMSPESTLDQAQINAAIGVYLLKRWPIIALLIGIVGGIIGWQTNKIDALEETVARQAGTIEAMAKELYDR